MTKVIEQYKNKEYCLKEMGNTKNRKTIVLSIKGGILNVN